MMWEAIKALLSWNSEEQHEGIYDEACAQKASFHRVLPILEWTHWRYEGPCMMESRERACSTTFQSFTCFSCSFCTGTNFRSEVFYMFWSSLLRIGFPCTFWSFQPKKLKWIRITKSMFVEVEGLYLFQVFWGSHILACSRLMSHPQ